MEKEIEIGGKIYEVHHNNTTGSTCNLCALNEECSCLVHNQGCITTIGLNGYLKEKKSMEKEIRIQVPEGMEIDKENSTFECIKFKPKSLTYDDIRRVFSIPGSNGAVVYNAMVLCDSSHEKKLEIYRKLFEVADYLNDGWKPDFDNPGSTKYLIAFDHEESKFKVLGSTIMSEGSVYFKTSELAKQAIKIIGEDNLKILYNI